MGHAEVLARLLGSDRSGVAVRVFDGSRAGPADAAVVIDVRSPHALSYLATAPSDLGLAPQSDGKVIRLNIPPLSGEVRRKMVARTKELAEETKVAIRNIRRDANKQAEQEKKDKELTEDECDSTQEDVQKLVKKFEDKSNELAKAKEAEVMND